MERFAKVNELLAEYESLEAQMADPAIHSDQNKARSLGKRYAQLGPVIAGYRAYKLAEDDLSAGKELAAADSAFVSELAELEKNRDEAAQVLEELLLPRDPNDDRDVIMEIKAGAGGDESAIFAGDLFRMYSRYAEKQGWKIEVIDATQSDMGGYKDISVGIKSKSTAQPGQTPYAKLKFEGGVHRVQRVPETESQGRIHTSAAGVLILPEAEEIDVEINMNDLRIDVYRSSGPGGQSVNTTDSAVRITHIPRTIGLFQVESPGQRELVGKLVPNQFSDLVIGISLFRPGPIKSEMISPFLNSRNGLSAPTFIHADLVEVLAQTQGVVVFHEQVILNVS